MSHLVIRADSGRDIGMGHAVRCFALAQAWQALGGRTTFLSCSEGDSLRRRVESSGFDFKPLAARHPDPSDLLMTLDLLGSLNDETPEAGAPWLVADGYVFTPTYHAAIRAAGFPLLVIDDVADQTVYHADVVLNQNIGANELRYRHDPDTMMLLGTHYALLRPEFASRRSDAPGPAESVRRVLVTMGGSDFQNVSLRVIRALKRTTLSSLDIVIVVGAHNPHGEALRREAESETGCHVRVMHDVDHMAELMRWADLAVSGAGSTCWELATLGVPSVLLVLADNQRAVAAGLDRAGAAVNLGPHQELSEERLIASIDRLGHDQGARCRMRKVSLALLDGHGARRVARTLAHRSTLRQRHGLSLRSVVSEDAIALWNLANDPAVRENAFCSESIPLERHLEWFQGKLVSDATAMWVLASGPSIAAQVRYDRISDAVAEIDYSVAENYRGRGLGTLLLELTLELACGALEVDEIWARVKRQNLASARAFEKAGFSERVDADGGEPDFRSFLLRVFPKTPGTVNHVVTD